MLNRKRSGSNDAGWGIWPSNYSRFLTQIDPGSGDVGLWNIDDSIYGRFARAFEHKSGKKQMRFKLDDSFAAQAVNVEVTYLDRGRGCWSLSHVGKSSPVRVQNTDSGRWKTETIKVSDAAELALNYESGDDTVFHMIEVERIR
jgi:hypothetical protein